MVFFLVFFAVATATGIAELPLFARIGLATLLVAAYAYYVRRTLHSGGALEEVPETLTLWRFETPPPTWAVVAQAALGIIVIGAEVFVEAVRGAAGLIALIVAPLATELPEKINSVLWARQGKDTLVLGNITGAVVFQSTVPVTFGILFTSWDFGPLNLFSAALALGSGGFIYMVLRRGADLHSWHLMVGGVFYLAFLLAAIFAIV